MSSLFHFEEICSGVSGPVQGRVLLSPVLCDVTVRRVAARCEPGLPLGNMALSLSLCCLSAAVSGLVCALVLQPLCFPYFWRDLLFLLKVVRSGVKLELYRWRRDVRTVLDRFVEQARRIPDKPFIIYDGSARTYRDVDRRSERLARVFLNTAELKKGDCVAMLMNNEPDYLCVWFGLAKVGCTVAFLNTNIRSKSVLHCLDCCGARTLIVGSGRPVCFWE